MNGNLYQVSDLKNSIRGILTGLNTNNISDFYGKLQRTATTILMKGDIPEMSDRYALELYDGVFDYTPPPTLFGSLVQDVRPQGISRISRLDIPYKKPIVDFDLMKQRMRNGAMITFEQRGMAQIMRLAQTRTQPKVDLGSVSILGGWVAGGAAAGLALDQTVYYEFPSSLRFNLASAPSGGLGYIETSINEVDLTAYEGVGVVFVAIQLPTGASVDVSSIGVHVGNNNANYWDVSATEGFLGAWQDNDFLLIALDLADAETSGSVTTTGIAYVRVYLNYTSVAQISNVRVGGIWVSLPTPYEILFETTAIFVPNGSTTPKRTVTADTDTLILGDAAYQLYSYELSREIALGKGGTLASGLIGAIDLVLEGNAAKIGLWNKFRQDNPNQTLKQVGTWA